MGSGRRRKKKGIGLIIVLVVLLLLCGGGFLAVNHYVNKIARVDEIETVAPADEDFETDENEGWDVLDPNDVEWGEIAPLMDDDLLNILLVGQDRRPGEGRQRSDTMILCSVNAET